MPQLNLNIDDGEFIKKFKLYCLKNNTSMVAVIRKLVGELLKNFETEEAQALDKKIQEQVKEREKVLQAWAETNPKRKR